jgi:F0F1-type ATP synthase epsilon subunit
MPWLSILSGVLKLGSILARMAERQRDVDSGAMRQAYKQQQKALGNVEKALAARRNVPGYLSGGRAGRVRDDPDRRD